MGGHPIGVRVCVTVYVCVSRCTCVRHGVRVCIAACRGCRLHSPARDWTQVVASHCFSTTASGEDTASSAAAMDSARHSDNGMR